MAEHTGDTAPDPEDPGAYVQQVMAEIAEEVRLRRASGDLPPKLERELDELFLAHAPVGSRGSDPGDALRMVDAQIFIDPVVPIESNRAGGAYVKKGMRSALLPANLAAVEIGHSWRHLATFGVLSAWAVAGLLVAPVLLRRMARHESGSAVAARREKALLRVQ